MDRHGPAALAMTDQMDPRDDEEQPPSRRAPKNAVPSVTAVLRVGATHDHRRLKLARAVTRT